MKVVLAHIGDADAGHPGSALGQDLDQALGLEPPERLRDTGKRETPSRSQISCLSISAPGGQIPLDDRITQDF